jgi:hypothetical protein
MTMPAILPDQLRMLRLQAQHLYPAAGRGDLVGVPERLCGVNAQQESAMMLSLRARIRGLEPGDVRDAIGRRALVRGWAMRGTLHLMPSRDLRWIVPLVGPGILARNTRRQRELGLTAGTVTEGLAVVDAMLTSRGTLARRDLVEGLVGKAGIPGEGQAAYHILFAAGMTGLICRGPDKPSGEETFRLTREWIGGPDPLPREEALEALIRRYLDGYGAAGVEDFISWSGLPPGEAREGWRRVQGEGGITEIQVGDRILLSPETRPVPAGVPPHPAVSLLPAFDTLVLGYHHREHVVPGRYRDRVYHGGQTVPVVLVNGAAAGTWRYDRRGKTLDVSVTPFERFNTVTRNLIREEAEDVGRIFGLPARVSFPV